MLVVKKTDLLSSYLTDRIVNSKNDLILKPSTSMDNYLNDLFSKILF